MKSAGITHQLDSQNLKGIIYFIVYCCRNDLVWQETKCNPTQSNEKTSSNGVSPGRQHTEDGVNFLVILGWRIEPFSRFRIWAHLLTRCRQSTHMWPRVSHFLKECHHIGQWKARQMLRILHIPEDEDICERVRSHMSRRNRFECGFGFGLILFFAWRMSCLRIELLRATTLWREAGSASWGELCVWHILNGQHLSITLPPMS